MIGAQDIHAAFLAVPSMPTTEALQCVGVDGEAVAAYACLLFARADVEESLPTIEGAFCAGLLLGVAAERRRRGDSAQTDPREQ